MILTFTALAQSSTPSDPFLAYADLLLKDQVLDAMKNWDFSCNFAPSNDYHSCTVAPEDGLFSNIHLVVAQGVPQYISFRVETDALQIGDLILLWDKPDTIFPYASSTLLWSDGDNITISTLVPPMDRLNYLAPVWVVTFTF